MGIPRRLGRLARGFVSTLQEDERLNERVRETIRNGRESGESLKDAVGAAWRGAAEEWRSSEQVENGENGSRQDRSREQAASRGASRPYGGRPGRSWVPRRYPPNVIAAYERLGLDTGTRLEEVHRKRRDLMKRYHPDRFSDPDKRAKAERLTAQINAAHDTIHRHAAKSG